MSKTVKSIMNSKVLLKRTNSNSSNRNRIHNSKGPLDRINEREDLCKNFSQIISILKPTIFVSKKLIISNLFLYIIKPIFV